MLGLKTIIEEHVFHPEVTLVFASHHLSYYQNRHLLCPLSFKHILVVIAIWTCKVENRNVILSKKME